MPIVAMTAELGSGGNEVAQSLADRIGLTLISPDSVLRNAAEHMQVPVVAARHRLGEGGTMLERWQFSTRRLMRYLEAEILEFAQERNILIRGLGACIVLRGVPQIARIRVCAPKEVRERSVMQQLGLDDRSAARREIERDDAAQGRGLHAVHGVDPYDPLLYDLLLNTEHVSIETCVLQICDLVERPEFGESEYLSALLRDRALAARIRIKLSESFPPGMGVSGLEAAVSGGKVVLSGTAIHTTLAADAGSVVGSIAGVKVVENEIMVVRGPCGRGGGIGGRHKRVVSSLRFLTRFLPRQVPMGAGRFQWANAGPHRIQHM